MALPTNISYGTVVGQFLAALQDGSDPDKLPEGVPMRGTVTFIASPTYVLDYTATPNPVTILKTPIICPLDTDGYVCSPYVASDSPLSPGVTLIATDDPDILPIGWTWTVMYALTDPQGRAISLPNQNISVPAGTTVDLTTAMNIATSNGVIITKGPQGEIGPIGPYGVPVTLTVGEVETGPETPGSIGPQGMKGEPGGLIDGTVLDTQDLNLLIVSGTYYTGMASTATLAKNYPVANVGGTVVVLRRGSDSIISQEYWTTGSTDQARVHYRRVNVTGTWYPWRAYTSARVDQTAGRAVYQWDDLNNREQLIYGDTGWRDVSSLLLNGATASWIRLRRQNSIVSLDIGGLKLPTTATTDSILAGISGFTSSANFFMARETVSTGLPGMFSYSGAVLFRTGINFTANNTTHLFSGTTTAATTDTWPATLPGIAYGTIPNL